MFKIGDNVRVKFFGAPEMVIVDDTMLDNHWVCMWYNSVSGGFNQETFPEVILCPDGTRD